MIIPKNIFACLFSVHNTISLSRHEQVCLILVCKVCKDDNTVRNAWKRTLLS